MNLFFVASGFFLYGLQRLLYGPLRPIETEQLYEKAWFAITETCLAMTIFRGEMGGWFLVMFVCLLFGKVWGWIGEGRVEILDQQPPANPRLFHARLATSLILSVVFDLTMLNYAVRTVLEQARPDMMVMFGFEFAVLSILSTSTLCRYGLSLMDAYITSRQKAIKLSERRAELRAAREEAIRRHRESGQEGLPDNLPNEDDVDEMELDVPGWEEKGRWVFYLDLVTDFCKLVVYLSFFAILFAFYGLPIHILRDVVVTIRSFGRRIMDFRRYRNATRDMHERYPDATAEEIRREDVCIICREEMVAWEQPTNDGAARPRVPRSDRLRPKKLPCGHVLHFACLRSWLERQQNCPTCRRPVVVPQNRPFRAGVNVGQGVGGLANQPNQAGAAAGGDGDGRPRARIYQLGPFRVGFGAGRGDLFNNLHQQIHGNNAPALNVPPGAQQIGFGFGFGRPPTQNRPATQATQAPHSAASRPVSASVQEQLRELERQINRELRALQMTAEQLHVVRLLQGQLEMLRAAQDQALQVDEEAPRATSSSSSSQTPSTRPRHVPLTTGAPIPAGDSRLPEGLVLPPGWTLTPLNPSSVPGAGATAPENPTMPSSEAESSHQAPTVAAGPVSGEAGSAIRETAGTPNAGVGESVGERAEQDRNRLGTQSNTFRWPPDSTDPEPDKDVTSRAPQPGPSNFEPYDEAESSSKGKARTATVEDVGRDED